MYANVSVDSLNRAACKMSKSLVLKDFESELLRFLLLVAAKLVDFVFKYLSKCKGGIVGNVAYSQFIYFFLSIFLKY